MKEPRICIGHGPIGYKMRHFFSAQTFFPQIALLPRQDLNEKSPYDMNHLYGYLCLKSYIDVPLLLSSKVCDNEGG